MNFSISSTQATLIVGLIAAFIALQQWLLARAKLRFDLFEKRYKVYEATKVFILTILTFGTFEDKALFEYTIGTQDAVFLFPKKINSYIYEIRCKALEMRLSRDKFIPLPTGSERTELSAKYHEDNMWITSQLEKLPKVFGKYLSFNKVI